MSIHIPVRIESLEKRRRMTGVLHIVGGFYLLAATAAFVTQRQFQNVAGALPFAIIALIAIVYGIRRKKTDPTAKYNSSLRGLEAVGLGLLAMSQTGLASYGLYAWAGLSVMLLFSEKVLFQPSVVELNEEGVQLPGSPKPPVLPWTELEGIIVRADFITFVRKDQKVAQLEVSSALSDDELKAANRFGNGQIHQQTITDHVA